MAARVMVLPIVLGVAVAVFAVGWLITWYRQPPKAENQTIRDLEERLRRQEERLRRQGGRGEEEEQRKSAQLVQAPSERAWVGKEQAGRAMAERERSRQPEQDMIAKEQELKEELRRAKQEADTERAARQRTESGIQPTKWPTRAEMQRGRDLIEYNAKNLHFAIVGKAGGGKSSLINAFLDLDSNQPGAAATGVAETTASIGRYPDPGERPPRPWTVWYDVPGAGTQNVSAWQYFVNQGLFVFDIIMIAIGDRFEETDIQLLRECKRFKIPALIVRSKADMHIHNLVKERGGRAGTVDRKSYQQCRNTFIRDSRNMVRRELEKAGLPDQEVYLVSSYTLREVYNRSLHGSEADLPSEMIDEKILIRAVMWLTIQRRSGDDRALQAAVELAMRGTSLVRNTAQAGRDASSGIRAVATRTLNAARGLSGPVNGDQAHED